eukprot:scaffold141029_cov23-Tisochrysis_lutea.AAC.1
MALPAARAALLALAASRNAFCAAFCVAFCAGLLALAAGRNALYAALHRVLHCLRLLLAGVHFVQDSRVWRCISKCALKAMEDGRVEYTHRSEPTCAVTAFVFLHVSL